LIGWLVGRGDLILVISKIRSHSDKYACIGITNNDPHPKFRALRHPHAGVPAHTASVHHLLRSLYHPLTELRQHSHIHIIPSRHHTPNRMPPAGVW
jgi:hypothetical protein